MTSRLRRTPLVIAALLIGALGFASMALGNGNGGRAAGARSQCHRSHKAHRFSAWDEQWLQTSIEGDLFEIQGGKLAQSMATTQQVRDLGATLVKDHTKSLQDATELAKRLGIEVPSEPSPSQQWELRAVQQFSGTQFDHWYADLEVQDHTQDIQEATDEVHDGWNHAVRHEAKAELPVLQLHLSLAQSALASATK